jgi:HEAT repeat protein
MTSNTHAVSPDLLRALIGSSVLLSKARKAALERILLNLDETSMRELETLLLSEDDVIRRIAQRAIGRAVEKGDTKFLEGLDVLIHGAMKMLRESGEREETKDETTTVEHIFDDAP